MRDHEPVVGRVPPAVRHALGGLVELLPVLQRPLEPEPARPPVLQAVPGRAGVQVEPGLDGPQQERPAELLLHQLRRAARIQQRPDQLGVHPGDLGEVVRMVLLAVLLRRPRPGGRVACLRLAALVRVRGRYGRHPGVALRKPPALRPPEHVRVERAPHLGFGTVEGVRGNAEGRDAVRP